MLRRFLLPALVVFVFISAVAAVADALVVTERERLAAVAYALSDEDAGRRVDALLRHVAPGREGVELSVDGRRTYYDEHSEVELAHALRDVLAFTEGRDLRTMQQTLNHEGEEGVVALRLRANGALYDVTLHLRRHDDRWLVRRVVVR